MYDYQKHLETQHTRKTEEGESKRGQFQEPPKHPVLPFEIALISVSRANQRITLLSVRKPIRILIAQAPFRLLSNGQEEQTKQAKEGSGKEGG